MRVLFHPVADPMERLEPGAAAEYLTDSIYHGLVTLLGDDLVPLYDMWHMHAHSAQRRGELYGRGFTLYTELPTKEWTPVADKGGFDLVVIPVHTTRGRRDLHHRNRELIHDALVPLFSVYPPNKLAFIDTLDQSNLYFDNLFGKVTYFKRELADDAPGFIRPIGYSVPACKVNPYFTEKTRAFAQIDPWNTGYIFTDEAAYYHDYATSYFGLTGKKGGWDCMRHYEILAAGCIPYFRSLGACPKRSLFRFPKDLVNQAMSLPGVQDGALGPGFDPCTYETFLTRLFVYTTQYLTTDRMAQYLLEEMCSE